MQKKLHFVGEQLLEVGRDILGLPRGYVVDGEPGERPPTHLRTALKGLFTR
ncbi:MAG: hypothetical protein H6760_03575 [Candidatus Nomurabacteria bacterium]|nr:MAG: hypothetical protein H6760_03575 [Candidatus Nomurabacteria bacterium]